ncbi:MAG TPA: alpha-galactosidase, partial [Candidatus Phocaeicola gallinarum]|nr:alpha-galactosidase [Candidatus Phocaeicola gallinarum]
MNIKKSMYLFAGASMFSGGLFAQTVAVSTPHTSLVIEASVGGELKQLYYGSKLTDSELENIAASGNAALPVYPVYGMNCQSETALAVKHGDGNMSLQMEVVKVESDKDASSTLTTVYLKDKVYPFYVNVCYRAYQDVDVIETWTEITHNEKNPVILNQFASAYLPIRRGNVWLSSLYGSWANEGRLLQEPLEPGMKVIKNKDGVRNSHTAHAEVMFSLDGKPQENTG